MQNVLADLAIESEAAIALDAAAGADVRGRTRASRSARSSRRCDAGIEILALQARAVVVAEAMEVLGGNGYVEESALPRLYREAPLNSIWEGSGNVMCLDVLRAARREPAAVEALLAELALARGGNARLDAHIAALTSALAKTPRRWRYRRGRSRADSGQVDESSMPTQGRSADCRQGRTADSGESADAQRSPAAVAVALAGALMVRHAPPAHAHCASRLDRFGSGALGTLPSAVGCVEIIAQASA